MELFNRKSQLQRVIETVGAGLAAADKNDLGPQRAGGGAARRVKTGLVAAGGLAGLTAASAAISSLRNSSKGASSDS